MRRFIPGIVLLLFLITFVNASSPYLTSTLYNAHITLNSTLANSNGIASAFAYNNAQGGIERPIFNASAPINYTDAVLDKGMFSSGIGSSLAVNTTLNINNGSIMFWQYKNASSPPCTHEDCTGYYMSSFYVSDCLYFTILDQSLYRNTTHTNFRISSMGKFLDGVTELKFNFTSLYNQWNHWAIAYSYPNITRIYRNGELLLEETAHEASGCSDGTSTLVFGSDYDFVHFSNNTFDDIIILNETLSLSRIQTYYNGTLNISAGNETPVTPAAASSNVDTSINLFIAGLAVFGSLIAVVVLVIIGTTIIRLVRKEEITPKDIEFLQGLGIAASAIIITGVIVVVGIIILGEFGVIA